MSMRTATVRLDRLALRQRTSLRRSISQKVHRLPGSEEAADFRPPWVYSAVHLLSITLIPISALYGALFYDFGDREHVFQPLRRWVSEKKSAFFTLSPEEERLIKPEITKPNQPSSKS